MKLWPTYSCKWPPSQPCVSVVWRKLIWPQVRSRMGAATGATAPGCAAWTAAAAQAPRSAGLGIVIVNMMNLKQLPLLSMMRKKRRCPS